MKEGVTEGLGVKEGVPEGLGVKEGVTEGVRLGEGVALAVFAEGEPLPHADREGEADTEAVLLVLAL